MRFAREERFRNNGACRNHHPTMLGVRCHVGDRSHVMCEGSNPKDPNGRIGWERNDFLGGLGLYERIIHAAIKVDDAPTIRAVEQEIRVRFSTLDHLTRAELMREARKAKRIVDANGVETYA